MNCLELQKTIISKFSWEIKKCIIYKAGIKLLNLQEKILEKIKIHYKNKNKVIEDIINIFSNSNSQYIELKDKILEDIKEMEN